VILPSVRGSRVSFRATTPDGCHCTAMLLTMRRAVAAAVAAVGGAGATDTCSVAVLLTSFSACRPQVWSPLKSQPIACCCRHRHTISTTGDSNSTQKQQQTVWRPDDPCVFSTGMRLPSLVRCKSSARPLPIACFGQRSNAAESGVLTANRPRAWLTADNTV